MHGLADHLFVVTGNAILASILQDGLGSRFQGSTHCETLAAVVDEVPEGDYLAIVDFTLSGDEVRRLVNGGLRLDPARVLLIADPDRHGAELSLMVGLVGGILEPSTGIRGIQQAAELVLAGVAVFPNHVLSNWRHASRTAAEPLALDGLSLTERERRVLSLLRIGRCNKTIAHELGISDATVRVHVRAVLRKLGVKNRTQAAVKAVATLNWPTPIQVG